jgi:hypothetical protein
MTLRFVAGAVLPLTLTDRLCGSGEPERELRLVIRPLLLDRDFSGREIVADSRRRKFRADLGSLIPRKQMCETSGK